MTEPVVIDVAEDKTVVLGKLRDQVKAYVAAEKLRLITERTFLTSVLDSSLGDPKSKESKYNDIVVVKDVHKLIGIILPVNTTPTPSP